MQRIEENIKLRLKTLPTKPGVYLFLDANQRIIYIGKAKNLKKRVNSYFSKNHESSKLKLLVTKIRDIHTTVVDTEWEALLLENSLIKKHKPRFNSMLKDDKTYPWIAISREEFPRIYATRHPNKEKEELFGPYASVRYMNTLLETISQLFSLRSCKILPKDKIPCIKYQIKRCSAPCAGYISQEEYHESVRKATEMIKGNTREVMKQLHAEMIAYATAWEFEKAQLLKEKLEILEQYRGKSVVVNPDITQLDVFTILVDEEKGYVNFMRVMEGAVVQSFTIEINHTFDKTEEEMLWMGILEMHERFGKLDAEILLPFLPKIDHPGYLFKVPKIGDKKKLLDLSLKNATVFMIEKQKRKELVHPDRHQHRVLNALQKALGMDRLPHRIECFDNSNTQGEDPVAAMVCFINGKPAKKEYRHFLIKNVVGANDYASMEEVVYRRYHRLLQENQPLPDLIIVDGGKGQLNAAYTALKKLHIEKQIFLIGIAERLENIYKVGDHLPLYMDKKSEAQQIIQRIRDEVHRVGITHHRQKRSKTSLSSQLDHIPGIGKVLSLKLLHHFKSVKKINSASIEEIAQVIGNAKAQNVYSFFHEEKKE